METAEGALWAGISEARAGARLGNISAAIQNYAESRGYSVVREYTGHGIGREMHEEPQIPNYGSANEGPVLASGMVLAIEPMVNIGTYKVQTKADGWTIVTIDGLPSAHFEHTVAVTNIDADILTI